MRLGLGLYKSLLNDDNFRFARQAGATDVVVQLVDYVKGGDNPSLTQNYLDGWGVTDQAGKWWTYEYLLDLRSRIESHGLRLAAIENFDPAHWHDILLDGSEKVQQIEGLKNMIRAIGAAGIPVMGYYFSLAGVWGWTSGRHGRGDARSIEFDANAVDLQRPIPNGMVWNMYYDSSQSGDVPPVSREEMSDRLDYFLSELLPVAEASGVKLVAHPDDPPMDTLRQTARLFSTPEHYEELISRWDSPSNGLEFCMGTIQEMPGSDVYHLLDKYSGMGKIGYVHFRNVVGKVPHYREAFVDEGDIDMIRALRILKKNKYQGVLIPDHTPEMTCAAPWHAGMAFALGYMKAAMQVVNK